MKHKSIGRYSSLSHTPVYGQRIGRIGRFAGHSVVTEGKYVAECKPPPIVISDVVLRASKAVEDADKRRG